MNLWPEDWKNQLKRISMKVDEENDKAVGMVNGRALKVRKFSIIDFWNIIICFTSSSTFVIGGLRMWDK